MRYDVVDLNAAFKQVKGTVDLFESLGFIWAIGSISGDEFVICHQDKTNANKKRLNNTIQGVSGKCVFTTISILIQVFRMNSMKLFIIGES